MLNEILKKKRTEAKMTQDEVAKIFNVARQTVSSWETGKNFPDIPTLIKISGYYNLSLDYMLKGDAVYMKKIEQEVTQLNRYKKINEIFKTLIYLLIFIVFIYLAAHEIGKAWYYITH